MNDKKRQTGKVIAVILSVVLVITLMITPLLLSFLSLLNTKTVTKVVTELLCMESDDDDDRASTGSTQVVTLSSKKKISSSDIGLDAVNELFGEEFTAKQISAVLESKAAKELIEIYTQDLTNAISDSGERPDFTARKIRKVVDDNIDEIVDILQDVDRASAKKSKAEVKKAIRNMVDEHADDIVAAMPEAEEMKDMILDEVPELEIVLKLLAMRKLVKWVLFVLLLVLTGAIFACRFSGLKGFFWLGLDYLIAAGAGVLVILGVIIASPAIGEMVDQFGIDLTDVVDSVVKVLTNGMWLKTLIILVIGGALFAVHFVLKALRAKKHNTANAQPVA